MTIQARLNSLAAKALTPDPPMLAQWLDECRQSEDYRIALKTVERQMNISSTFLDMKEDVRLEIQCRKLALCMNPIGQLWMEFAAEPDFAMNEIMKAEFTEQQKKQFCLTLLILRYLYDLLRKFAPIERPEPFPTLIFNCKEEDKNYRLSCAYIKLKNCRFISKSTDVKNFFDFFAEELNSSRIMWIGSPAALAYFINQLVAKKYVSIPKGTRKWVLVNAHFVNEFGWPFYDVEFNKQHVPKKQKPMLDEIISIFNVKDDEQESDVFNAKDVFDFKDGLDYEEWKGSFVLKQR